MDMTTRENDKKGKDNKETKSNTNNEDRERENTEKSQEDIKKKINEGYYVTAQKLPSEYDLADEYDISRLTVRKAINLLIDQNVLIKLSGKGTYVIKPHKQKKGIF